MKRINNRKKNNPTLTELLVNKDKTIRRNAMSIYKKLERLEDKGVSTQFFDEWCAKCGKSGSFPDSICPSCYGERNDHKE